MDTIEEARRTSFNSIARLYEEARPLYPKEALDRLFSAVPLQKAASILEIGAGTGKLSRLLLKRGFHITAVEPGRELVNVLRTMGEAEQLEIVCSPFEAFSSASRFPLAIAAQSFHWIDRETGLQKLYDLLTPAGAFARIDNLKDVRDDSIRHELDSIYERHFPDRDYFHGYDQETLQLNIEQKTKPLLDSTLFNDPVVSTFRWTEIYSSKRYLKLLCTYSDHLVLADKQRDLLLSEVRKLIDRYGGSIEVPYLTLLQVSYRAER